MYKAVASAIPIAGGVVTAATDGIRADGEPVAIFGAGHPAPNDASVAAAERSLALAREAAADGGLLVLLSGGASAMLVAPRVGLTLDDKLQVARNLMAGGAAIHELNCVRKHLSRIKGGQLAAAARRTTTLALSDVHGPIADDPSVIASGPTVPDETTFSDALDVIRSRHVEVPPRIQDYLTRGARGDVDETIKPGDPRIAECTYTIIGNRHTAVNGAKRAAEQRGYHVIVIPEATAGEARVAGIDFVSQAGRLAQTSGQPLCVISSGETTVTVKGDGLGGRNQEFALAAMSLIGSVGDAAILASAGTDGVDGPTRAAGAMVDTSSAARATRLGADWHTALARNDSYRFFEALGDLIVWGPTGTNVGDLHVMLIASPRSAVD
jgi:glycerate 2-kinase